MLSDSYCLPNGNSGPLPSVEYEVDLRHSVFSRLRQRSLGTTPCMILRSLAATGSSTETLDHCILYDVKPLSVE